MAKKKQNNQQEQPQTIEAQNHIRITGGKLNDTKCDFSYKDMRLSTGDSHSVKSSDDFTDDLRKRFNELAKHLAAIDDPENGDPFKYEVTEFQIKGAEANESVILKGEKYIHEVAGRMQLVSPKILLDSTGGYQDAETLKIDPINLRSEIYLYAFEGKKIVEKEEIQNENQLNLLEQIPSEFESKEV